MRIFRAKALFLRYRVAKRFLPVAFQQGRAGQSHTEQACPQTKQTTRRFLQGQRAHAFLSRHKEQAQTDKYQTEILCWEFKGRVKDNEFLVYINAETGKEEDILVILETEGRNINNLKKVEN